jgi:hypothetical protein
LSSSASALDPVSEAVLASSFIVVYRQSIIYQCPQPLSHLITDKPSDIRQQRTRMRVDIDCVVMVAIEVVRHGAPE